jgi:hypothetical protein
MTWTLRRKATARWWSPRHTIAFHGTYQQGFRVVPTDRTSGITDVSVGEVVHGQLLSYSRGPNQADTYSTSNTADGLRIDWRFPPSTDAVRTFRLRYTAHGVIRVYPGGDQVDWNAVYADRPGPVASATVTLHLPADVAPSDLQSALYTLQPGRPAQQVGAASMVDARTLRYDVGSLPAGIGAEVRAQVPASVFPLASAPAWQSAADREDWLRQTVQPIGTFLVLLLSVVFAAGGGVGLLLLWYTRGREPDPGRVAGAVEEPPSDLPAPLAGTLVDGVADVQDAVAILVDLARRGVLSLRYENGDVRVGLHGWTEDPRLRSYERVLLVALFGRGVKEGEVLLSGVRPRFASAVPVLADRLYAAVAEAGLFVDNPLVARRRYARLGWLGVGVGLALGALTAVLFGWLIPAVWLPGAVLAVLGGVLVRMSRGLAPRTPVGALEAQRWRAFRDHLRQEPPASGLTDGHLAYAVAFGIDREFLRRLEWAGAALPAAYAPRGMGPVIFLPGGWYGGGGQRHGGPAPQPTGGAGPATASGPQGWSDALADLLNAASGALSSGGGSGPWSGGGWGGGGGGGGGSGGFN